MAAYCLVLLVSLTAAAGNEQVIDAFQYADSAAARGAWMVGTGTPPVEAAEQDGRRVLQFRALHVLCGRPTRRHARSARISVAAANIGVPVAKRYTSYYWAVSCGARN